MLISFQAKSSHADVGPKPYLIIEFDAHYGEYYITFLSENEPTGRTGIKEDSADYSVYQKFKSFADKDGYHFSGYFMHSSDKRFTIRAYEVPDRFKVLLYFPQYDCFAISDKPYEKYAYNSYYSVNLRGVNFQSPGGVGVFKLEAKYDYSFESKSFVLRVIATIGIETIFALFFGFKQKKQLQLIILTNIVTQTLLNILLNIIHYKTGIFGLVLYYFWLETLVFIIEAIVYANFLTKVSNNMVSKGRAVFYALVANTVSYFVGVIIVILFSTTIL